MPLLVFRLAYSSVVSHSEPVHTPWAPSASEAAIWRPRADATGAEHGDVGADGVDDLGGEHHAGDLAGVAAGLVALGHDDVHAVLHVRQRVLGGTGERRDRRRPCACACSITSTGGEPSALAISTGRWLQRDVDVGARDRVQPAEDALAVLALRERGYAELLQRALARS